MDPLSQFELSEWDPRIPLDRWTKVGFAICGPGDVVRLERCRKMAQEKFKPGRTLATDVFVFAIGKAPRRDLTMVGGVPYRPANEPWPMSIGGEPMVFLAQYRFTESKDVVGDVPGDMLLVFAESRRLHATQPQHFLHFEWHPSGIDGLIAARDVPTPTRSWEWDFVHCYGQRYRTVDYWRIVPLELLEAIVCPEFVTTPPYIQDAESLSRIRGMKIGGLSAVSYDGSGKRRRADVPGRFLCSLSTIAPALRTPHPWLNHPDPIPNIGSPGDDCLEFLDGFILNLYLQDSGEIRWVMHML